VWKESEVKDPPKEAPWWQSLALAALKAATGGVAGVFIDMAATALTGGEAKPGQEKSIGAKIGKAVISKVLEKGAEAIIDKVFGSESEKKSGGGGKEGVASDAATSTDPKIAFFESQSDTLIAAGQGSQEEAIGQIADLRGGPDFAKDPEGAIAAIKNLKNVAVQGAEGVKGIQADETRAKYASFLAGGTSIPDSLEMERTVKYNKKGEQEAYAWFENNVSGMVSMEIEPGPTPRAPVKVIEAWVKGMNKPLREQLMRMNLSKLKVPMRARGRMVDSEGVSGFVSVVRDGGYARGSAMGDPGTNWLVAKGGGGHPEEAKAKAAEIILDTEIGSKPLSQQVEKMGD
jgi:hypothetical protein